MEQSKPNTGKHWVFFTIWTIIMILLLVYLRQYFWLALPGVCTSFSKAMNIM